MEKTEDWVLDSGLDSVDFAEEAVLREAGKLDFDPATKEEDLHRIGMSVRECMVNAVVHGNRYNARKKVGLRDDAGAVDHCDLGRRRGV
jgi:serine/threonine-protein kinase RsbW